MITGKLIKQHPRPSKAAKAIAGWLTVDHGHATWWDDPRTPDGKPLAELDKPEIESCSTHGLMLRGFESIGSDEHGTPLYRFQRWYITPQKH